MSFARFNGINVARALVRIPSRGIWTVRDLELETAVPFVVGTPATLIMGGMTLVGRIFRGEVYPGGSTAGYVLEGGNAGWRRTIRAACHVDDSGVRLSTVLAAVIADMPPANKESIVFAPTSERVLGQVWMRDAGPASRSLAMLNAWYMRLDGITICGPRDPGTVADVRCELDFDPAARVLTVATETPELWTPGLTLIDRRLASPFLVREVTITVDSDKMRLEATG